MITTGTKRERDRQYKLQVRHGGWELRGACSNCGKIGTTYEIVMHHVKNSHEGQILLCRSCHMKVHGAPDKRKDIPIEQVREAINSSNSCEETAIKLGLSKGGFFKLRKRLNLLDELIALNQRSREQRTKELRAFWEANPDYREKAKQNALKRWKNNQRAEVQNEGTLSING